jgi:DNA-binding GntR family transcriptional regulator
VSAGPLARRSTVEALGDALRERILSGDLAPGARLREQELADAYDVARHTVRAALRALEAEGLVAISPNRGASVARLSAEAVQGLFELRTALEVEAARLALAAHGGRLPPSVHLALDALEAACEPPGAGAAIVAAHDGLHTAIVEAGGSARIAAAHRALAGETRLFVVQLPPRFTPARMAADHRALVHGLERDGPEILRLHLAEAAAAVLDALARAPGS